MTAVDTLPLVRLGREEPSIQVWLTELASSADDHSTEPAGPIPEEIPIVSGPSHTDIAVDVKLTKVDRESIGQSINGAAGPTNSQGQAIPGSNRHWPNSAQAWSAEFSRRMRDILADQWDARTKAISEGFAAQGTAIQKHQATLSKAVADSIRNQHKWLVDTVQSFRDHDSARLSSLWWAEALYSESLGKSYRELSPAAAAVAMSVDLLACSNLPTPPSVAYLLSETIHRLPDASYDKKRSVLTLLNEIHKSQDELPTEWRQQFEPPPEKGRLSLRDAIVTALSPMEWDADQIATRAGLSKDTEPQNCDGNSSCRGITVENPLGFG